MSSPEPPQPPLPPPPPRGGAPLPPTQPLAAHVPPPPVVERLAIAPPPERPWWGSPGAVFLAVVVGVLSGGLLGYAIGSNSESTKADHAAMGHTVTRTVTTVQPKVVVRTDTVTDKTVTQSPSPASQASEQRASEAEASVRRLQRENEELKSQQGEG